MFKSPIEWLKELIHDLVKEFADAAFSWLKIYMINPTDFEKYGFVGELYNWVFTISISIGIMFFIYNLFKVLIQQMGGYSQRGTSEILVKAITGTLLGIFAPFILKEVLLKLNNVWVEFIISKGINVDTLAKMITYPDTAGMALVITALVLAIMFLILAIQYIIRTGELMVLFLFSSLAAVTSTNEDMNIWNVWWREAVAVVFQQSFQITILWLIFNQIAGGKELKDYILACGLMVIVIKGPGFLRKFLYSTGTGKMAVGATGGAGKMAIYKYAATKMIK